MSVKHTIDKFVRVDRYYISGLHPHIWKHPEGEMVYFDDYVDLWSEKERLKAEVERLRASSFVTAVPIEQYERLLEAGDALAREICILGPVDDKEMKAIEAWNAAKEGKPSV